MHVLWKLGKGFLKDIVEATPEPRPHANTVATLLKILVEKGFVEYEVFGRNNMYRSRISRQEYGRKSANQLVKGYFEGSPAKLVSHFLAEQKMTEAELEQLLQQIQQAKNNRS